MMLYIIKPGVYVYLYIFLSCLPLC